MRCAPFGFGDWVRLVLVLVVAVVVVVVVETERCSKRSDREMECESIHQS